MLTLEKKVVENAKAIGINLSQIAEDAIKEKLQEKLRPRGGGLIQVPRVEKFILKNVGPFRGEKEISFSPGLNLVVGPNASGKSTVLDSISAVYSGRQAPTKNMAADPNEESYIRVVPEDGMVERKIKKEAEAPSRSGPKDQEEMDLLEGAELLSVEGIGEKMKKHLKRFEELPEEVRSKGEEKLREIISQSINTRETECYLNDGGLMLLDLEVREMVLGYLKDRPHQTILTASQLTFEKEDMNVIELEEMSLYVDEEG